MTVPIPESQDDAPTEEALFGELFAQRYRLGPILGRGGTALVHRAVDERLRRTVALKVFRLDADADLVRRFVVEARLLTRLHHPGLVEIFDYGHVPQGPYLALELISGPTLRGLIAAGPLPFTETMRIGRAVADTLAYIHGAGVVHRDVKPSNILLDEDGMPRLTDFGVSLAVDTAGTTKFGNVVGTAAYLAPEQVLGDRADSAADIFALGLVLIECLTGHREYPGLPAEAAVARLQRLPTVPQGLPRGVSQMLEQMTAWDPAERPEAEQCSAVFGRPRPNNLNPPLPELELLATPFGADDETAWVHPAVPRPVAGTGRSGRRLSAALAAVAVLAAAGVAVIAFGPGVGSPTAQVPAVVAHPQLTTAPGSGPTTAPPPRKVSSASTPAPSSSSPAVRSVLPIVVPVAAVHVDSEAKTKKDKGHGHGDGHGGGDGHGKNS